MKISNFLRILAVTLLLSGYATWARSELGFGRKNGSAGAFPVADQIPLLTTEEAAALWADPNIVFVDVRPETDYAVGHIKGAVHLPLDEYERAFPAVEPRLKNAAAIVVYCKSLDCGKSYWAALRLHKAGLTQTKIYPAGWNEWVIRGYPVVKAER
jgi:rhodanese-related sulfurtransferase